MQRPPLFNLTLGLVLAVLASACTHGTGFSGPPVYDENEINDSAFQANDFGVLRPGDHFFIRGDISDLGFDPFDGFAFTAGEPIHVDFQLFADRPGDDFDVCLYDPFLDLTIDCFQTPFNPEQGGVDVFGGGFDFHLVVESFFGSGGYELEIEVYSLFAASADDSGSTAASVSAEAQAQRMAASSHSPRAPARADANASSFEAYAKGDDQAQLDANAPKGEVILLDVDPETGETKEAAFFVLADGSLQPKP